MWGETHSCRDLSRSSAVAVPRSESQDSGSSARSGLRAQGAGGRLSEPRLDESWDELVVFRLNEDDVSLILLLALLMGRTGAWISISSDPEDWEMEPSDAFLRGSEAEDVRGSSSSDMGHRPDRDSGVMVHSFRTADL